MAPFEPCSNLTTNALPRLPRTLPPVFATSSLSAPYALPPAPSHAHDPNGAFLQARTPVGSFQGVFAKVSAVQLGVAAVKGVLAQSGVKPDQVEDLYFGNVLQGGVGQSPARQVVLGAGCPESTEATTVNKVRAPGGWGQNGERG